MRWSGLALVLLACDTAPTPVASTTAVATATAAPSASATPQPSAAPSANEAPVEPSLSPEQANEKAILDVEIELLEAIVELAKTLPKDDPDRKLFLMEKVVTYNEKTDPNELLGRPGQYIGKMNWPMAGDEATIEAFANAEDAKRRATYLETIGKSAPMFLTYIVVHPTKHLVLRLPKALQPAHAKKWEALLLSL